MLSTGFGLLLTTLTTSGLRDGSGRTLDKDLLDALWPDLCAAAVLEELAVLALGRDAGRGVVFLHGAGRGHSDEGLAKGEEAGGESASDYIVGGESEG